MHVPHRLLSLLYSTYHSIVLYRTYYCHSGTFSFPTQPFLSCLGAHFSRPPKRPLLSGEDSRNPLFEFRSHLFRAAFPSLLQGRSNLDATADRLPLFFSARSFPSHRSIATLSPFLPPPPPNQIRPPSPFPPPPSFVTSPSPPSLPLFPRTKRGRSGTLSLNGVE